MDCKTIIGFILDFITICIALISLVKSNRLSKREQTDKDLKKMYNLYFDIKAVLKNKDENNSTNDIEQERITKELKSIFGQEVLSMYETVLTCEVRLRDSKRDWDTLIHELKEYFPDDYAELEDYWRINPDIDPIGEKEYRKTLEEIGFTITDNPMYPRENYDYLEIEKEIEDRKSNLKNETEALFSKMEEMIEKKEKKRQHKL